MEITQKHKQQIEDIIAEMQAEGLTCLKNFECYHSSFEKLCKIEGIGAFDNIECDSKDAQCCGLSVAALSKFFCKCPLRRYISKNFHK